MDKWIQHLHCKNCEYPVDIPSPMVMVSRKDLAETTQVIKAWELSKMINSKKLVEANNRLVAALEGEAIDIN